MKSSQSFSVAPRHARQLPWLVGLLVCSIAGCTWRDGGLAGGGVSVEPALPPSPPGLPAADAGPAKPTPPAGPADAGVAPPKDAGSADATVVSPPGPMPPPPNVTPPDAGSPPPPSPDAAAVDSTPPPIVDQCAPGVGLLSSSVRLRFQRADDFTFDNEGRLLIYQSGDILQVGSSERDSLTLVRNVGGLQGGTLRVLPDGDILVADASRDHLLRVDPSARRPDRNEMSIRSPLKLVPEPGSGTTFYVTTQSGTIYRADTVSGTVRSVVELDFKAGGLAVDGASRRLYVGALGKNAVVAYTIGPQGELTNRVNVAEAIPQPTALAVDSCGGVFIAGGEGGAVRRIGLAGATTVVARLEARDITTLEFGSGKHGWAQTSLYALDTYWGEVTEIRIKR